MKKVIAILLAVLMLVGSMVLLASCGAKKTQTVFKPNGTSKGTLKLGFDADYPPYGYLDDKTNQYAGFDLDFAKEVCAKIGYTLELIPINWDFKDTELGSGNIDCIWSGFTIEGRESDYAWTVPYSNSSIVILVDKNSTIASVSDLAGKKVAVQQESSGQAVLDDEENAALVASFAGGKYLTIGDYTAAYNNLVAGDYDAVVIDVGVANSFVAKGTTKILSEALSSETYGVGFRTSDKELCKLISDTMVSLGAKAQEIAKTYGLEDSIILGK